MFRGISPPGATRDAYAVSHVGFGMNPAARYEALSMDGQRDNRNGTEIRTLPAISVLDWRQRIRRPLYRRPFRFCR